MATCTVRFNTRPGWRLAQAMTNGCSCGWLAGAILAAVGGLPAFLLGLAAGGALGAAVSLVRTGRRSLLVNDEGITAIRTGYQLRAGWDDLASFEVKRFAGVVPVETIVLSHSTILRSDGVAVPERLRRKIERAGADRRIQLGVYVKDRRQGRFFEMLQRHRPDLAQS